ncbi:MAG: hypothetical protein WC457_02635 [Patescibacteria group bacterium]
MKTSVKVFVACLIGAGIGSLVALDISHAFWWVGLAVGGLAGYLSYEVRAVGRAMATAWKSFGWSTFRSIKIRARLWRLLGFLMAVVWFALPVVSYYWKFTGLVVLITSLLCICGALYTLAWFTLPFYVLSNYYSWHDECDEYNDSYDCSRRLVLTWSLPAIIYHFLRVTTRVVCLAPKSIFRFVRFVFLQIHSDIRLLCGVDSLLGAMTGYMIGSVIVGAVAGGILGVLNYVVVSKKILAPRGLVTIRE